MPALICLGVAIVCALISRALLIVAAFATSFWWGIGVLLPFGPLLFRLNHQDEATRSRVFGLLSVPCFFGYFVLGPTQLLHNRSFAFDGLTAAKPTQFALEVPHRSSQPSLDARRAANKQELARLQDWNAKLRVTKRDLLHSDADGNRRYTAELAQYNAALAGATAEKTALAIAK